MSVAVPAAAIACRNSRRVALIRVCYELRFLFIVVSLQRNDHD